MPARMSKTRVGLSVFIIVIVVLFSYHKLMRYFLESDHNVSSALSTAKTEALPLIDALEEFHRARGFYPRSIKQLPRNPLWGKYLYQINDLNAVYQSLDCQKRVRDLMGWQTAEKRQKMLETKNECILGYSQFVIKSQVQPAPLHLYAFVIFESTNPQWDVDWCNHSGEGRNFCADDLEKLQDENRQ
jgi:hypothetical protein